MWVYTQHFIFDLALLAEQERNLMKPYFIIYSAFIAFFSLYFGFMGSIEMAKTRLRQKVSPYKDVAWVKEHNDYNETEGINLLFSKAKTIHLKTTLEASDEGSAKYEERCK